MDQGGYHHLDVLRHELETVYQCDRFLDGFTEFSEELRQPIKGYCAENLVEGRSRKALIKLCALLHDVGKPGTRRVEPDGEIWFIGHDRFGSYLIEDIALRLKLSVREKECMERLVLHHLRPGHLSREAQLTRRAIFRFFRDLQDDGVACLLLWWADRMATRGPSSKIDQIGQQRQRLEELLGAYFFRQDEVVRPPRLIDGNELMDCFGLEPGPIIGKILQIIEESQAEGKIENKQDAMRLARHILLEEKEQQENR
jgi:poly(A) polymerase